MTGSRFVLHKHCPAWEFQLRCRGLAIERDDLSLLGAITAKERVKFEEKGISTITQCSARAIAVSSISSALTSRLAMSPASEMASCCDIPRTSWPADPRIKARGKRVQL
jgi:predicted RecB family nuclease